MRGSTASAARPGPPYGTPTTRRRAARRQKSRGGFRTQKEAQTHLATVITSVAEGTYVEPSKQPLGRFLVDEWLPAIRGSVRPLTAERYAKTVRLYVTSREIGTVPLRGLSGGHLTGLYNDLEREGLSVATRRLTHSVLRRALNDAVRWDKLLATLRMPPTLPGHPPPGAIVDGS